MQIMIFIAVTIALIVFLIFTINKKFGKKELLILLAVLIVPISILSFLLRTIAQEVPDIFKEKYQNEKKVEILKLSYERINNKNLSNNTIFIYNFDFIIKKDKKDYICNAKKVVIKKIEDEFVFENFDKLNEKCTLK